MTKRATLLQRLRSLGKINWCLCLISPVALICLALAIRPEFDQGRIQDFLDRAGAFLLGLAVILFAVRTVMSKNPWHLIITCVAGVLFCRELHFAGTSLGVYIALGVIGLWVLAWHKKLAAIPVDWPLTSWLIATAVAYVLAQVVDRRVFGAGHLNWIPNDQIIHSTVEESMETVAHIMFIYTACIGFFASRSAPQDLPCDEQAPNQTDQSQPEQVNIQ